MRLIALALAASLAWPVAFARTLGDGERRNGAWWVVGGSVELLPGSRLDGDLWLLGGEAWIDGLLIGDVIAPFGTVRFGPMAVVRGRVWAGGLVERHPDALFTRPSVASISRRDLAAAVAVVVAVGGVVAIRFVRGVRRRS